MSPALVDVTDQILTSRSGSPPTACAHRVVCSIWGEGISSPGPSVPTILREKLGSKEKKSRERLALLRA